APTYIYTLSLHDALPIFVLRWSETERNDKMDIPGVKKIFLGSDDIEGTIDDMLSCKRIVSSSLHGLILADAYGIPNASARIRPRSEEHTSELQSRENIVC